MIKLSRRAVLAAGALAPFAAHAQTWPSGPIRFIVPFTAGGSVDIIPRLLQPGMQERLGVPVIVENRPGGSGTTGTAVVAKAPADGSTWLSIADTLAVSAALLPNLPFDTEKDLDPVIRIGTSPYVLAANLSRPYKTLAEVIAAAKKNPKTISYGSFGTGSGGHLAMLQFAKRAGIELIHVPYRGGNPAVADAMAGHIDLVMGSTALVTPLLQTGKLHGIAQFGPDRLPGMANLPTIGESGFKDCEAVVFWGLYATAGTPAPIVDRFRQEVMTSLKDPKVAKQITEDMHIQLTLEGSDFLRKFLKEQIAKWATIIKENNIKAE